MSKHLAFPAAAIAFVLAAAPAFAHTELVSTTPAANAIIAPTKQIDLRFSEGLEPKFSSADLSSTRMMMGNKMTAHVMKVDGAKAVVDPADHKHLVVTVPTALAPGEYKLAWHVVSADSHRAKGSFIFTVK